VKLTKPHLSKLEDKSTPMVFLGYEVGSKAYQLYNLREGNVTVLCGIFDEKAAWD